MECSVVCLVGNGFDIGALSFLRGVDGCLTTSYGDFVSFLRQRPLTGDSNPILSRVVSSGEEGNWCDLEAKLSELVSEAKPSDANSLNNSLFELSFLFNEFLEFVAGRESQHLFAYECARNDFARNALQYFLQDWARGSSGYPANFLAKLESADSLHFEFVNLNYTPLLDIYLDLRYYFDSEKGRTQVFLRSTTRDGREAGFGFRTRAESFKVEVPAVLRSKDTISSEVLYPKLSVNIEHPHGTSIVPGSAVFGVADSATHLKGRGFSALVKSNWVRGRKRYADALSAADLIVVFGSSLSASDGWWWGNMRDALVSSGFTKELLIYAYDRESSFDNGDEQLDGAIERIKRKFIENSVSLKSDLLLSAKDSVDINSRICDRIFVRLYADVSEIRFLGMQR